jgi:hypothetical protein
MFVLHLGDWVGLPENVGDLVHLRPKRAPELSQNQGDLLPDDSFYYYEEFTMKEIGAQDKTNTLFMAHSPSAVGDLFHQMQDAVMIGQKGAAPG